MIQFISLLLFSSSAFAASVEINDFKTQIDHGDATHSNLWAIELAPPAGHHFNLEAPRSASVEKIQLELVQESPSKIIFQTENAAIHSGAKVSVSAYVCDEKKTYCMVKKMQVILDEKKSKVITEKFSAQKEVKATSTKKQKKAAELFIDNNPSLAIQEAKKTGKPLLIDFYGIWCPPCNLYNEIIFNTKKFAEQSKRFVLLKMDADDEKSWELKSQFKVGGYPTLLLAKLNEKGSLEEMERIIGYFPPSVFYSRLDQAYQHRNDTLEQRWKGRLEELLSSYLDQKNYDEIIKLTDKSKEAKILIYRWIAEAKKNADFIKDPKNLELVKESIEAVAKNIQSESNDTITHAVDLLNEEFWLKQDHYYKMANDFIDQLVKRIDPNTMFVTGTELTLADLDSMKLDLAETLNHDQAVSEIRKKAISSYEKLIAHFAEKGNRDLRGLNLEYAFLLWKDGKIDQAQKIYQQFIKKFPAEFTFYYAASKMYLTIKDFAKAREFAESAYKYSYGDNRIRAMERLVSVMAEQGWDTDAIFRGNQFLKTVKVPAGGISVRTGRYIEALKTTISKIEKTHEGKK